MKLCHICLVIIHLFVFFHSPKNEFDFGSAKQILLDWVSQTDIHPFILQEWGLAKQVISVRMSYMSAPQVKVDTSFNPHILPFIFHGISSPFITCCQNTFSPIGIIFPVIQEDFCPVLQEHFFLFYRNFFPVLKEIFSVSIGTFFSVLQEHFFWF